MTQPNQRVERECALCGKIRGLYDFSATQRRKGDDAACLRCIPEIQNVKPGHLSQEWDESDADYMVRVNGSKKSTTGSVTAESGGVRLPAQASFSRTAGSVTSARLPASSVTTKTAPSSRLSSNISNRTDATLRNPHIEVGATGWVKIKKGHRVEIVPDLMDDDVETFRDGDDGEFDM